MSMKHISALDKAFREKYLADLVDFREYLKIDFNSELLTDDFHEALFKILFSTDLEKYSPLKYYWLKTVEDFFYTIELHYDIEDQNLTDDDDEYSEDESIEEIEESWLKSLFSDGFSQMLDEGLSVTDASMAMVPLMESQILSFYYLHISSEEVTGETAFLYNSNPELGDFNNRIHLSDSFYSVDFDNENELFPSIPISDIDYDRKVVGIEINAETEFFEFNTKRVLLHVEDKTIPVIGASDLGEEKANEVVDWIEEFISNNKQVGDYLSSLKAVIISEDIEGYETQSKLPGILYLNTSVDAESLTEGIARSTADKFASILEVETEEEIDQLFKNPWSGEKDSVSDLAADYATHQLVNMMMNSQADKKSKSCSDLISKALRKVSISSELRDFLNEIQ